MVSSISRKQITDRVLAELGEPGFPVGDNSAPEEAYGWQGEPNEANTTFVPWLVLTPGIATQQTPMGGMGDTGTNWKVGYNVFLAGVSRKQTEALADRIRDALTNIVRESITTPTGSWRIQKISCQAIGSNNRVGSAYPDYFTQSDNYEVWITKG